MKNVLFAVLFIVLGLIASALIMPAILPNANHVALGELMFPVIVIVCGFAGYRFGKRRALKQAH